MELKILAIDEEGENKRKSIAFKAEESDFDGDMYLIVKNFKILIRHEKKEKKEQ